MELVLEDVVKERGFFRLEASGVFEEGVHLVTGRIGSGKTTLALLMGGVIPLDSGRIERRDVNSLLLTLQFPEEMVTATTVAEEIASWGLDSLAVLEKMRDSPAGSRDPLGLSRGELKRLQLFAAFERDPDILLLDEPFSSLDCISRRELIGRIESRKNRITVLFTHTTGALPRVNRIWEMVGGRLLELGSPPEAILRWRDPPRYIRTLVENGAIPQNIGVEDARSAGWKT